MTVEKAKEIMKKRKANYCKTCLMYVGACSHCKFCPTDEEIEEALDTLLEYIESRCENEN